MRLLLLRVYLVTLVIIGSVLIRTVIVKAHNESGEWSCESDDETQLVAEFRPGVVTVDGRADDWSDVEGFDFPLRPALDPDADREYKGGKMTVKALHDGKDVSFLLQVDGDYVYSKGDNNKWPSVALMFQIGESATYHNMGGCKESPSTCTSKSCRGYEVDIMHFSIGNAIPGRLYGGNPIDNREGNGGDRFGHLVDLYAWNPHCRNLDGISSSGNDTSAQNNWKGAWWHSSFTKHTGFIEEDNPYSTPGQKGTYYFELSRPLRTMDRLQQDVQFTIGQPSKFSAAFWYPVDGNPCSEMERYEVKDDDGHKLATKRLMNKVAVVTGGARGIGAATAKLFAKNGAHVVVADVLDELGTSLADSINGRYIHCDVSKEMDVESAIQLALSWKGKLDIMFNNAGISGLDGSIMNQKMEHITHVLAVNLNGTVHGIKHAARAMIKGGNGGTIVCTSSSAAIMGGLASHAYTMSKEAILGVSRTAACELGEHGIRVNCVSPHGIPTDMLVNAFRKYLGRADVEAKEVRDLVTESGSGLLLRGRCGKVEDVAEAVLFLASDEAGFITGHNLVVDGGYTAASTQMSFIYQG